MNPLNQDLILRRIRDYINNTPYFKLYFMNKLYILYFAIVVSSILLIMNISELDFNNLQKGPFTGIIGNVILIGVMIVTIRDLKNSGIG